METVFPILMSIAIGLIVGMLSGLIGVGGGTILVPVFKLIYGMQGIVAAATSLFTIIPTSISGAIAHIRYKTCLPKLGIVAGIGGAITSPFGVWFANISPEWTIMVIAALVIGYSAVTMFRKAIKLRAKKTQAKQLSTHSDTASSASTASDTSTTKNPTPAESYATSVPTTTTPTSEKDSIASGSTTYSPSPSTLAASGRSTAASPTSSTSSAAEEDSAPYRVNGKQLLIGGIIGLSAGVVSGYVGVGGGFIMIPMFMQILGIPMKVTSGTSLIAVLIIAIPGTISQALLGNVDFLTGIFIAVGSIPGAALGSKLSKHVSELALRFCFSIFLLIASVLLVVDQFHIF